MNVTIKICELPQRLVLLNSRNQSDIWADYETFFAQRSERIWEPMLEPLPRRKNSFFQLVNMVRIPLLMRMALAEAEWAGRKKKCCVWVWRQSYGRSLRCLWTSISRFRKIILSECVDAKMFKKRARQIEKSSKSQNKLKMTCTEGIALYAKLCKQQINNCWTLL